MFVSVRRCPSPSVCLGLGLRWAWASSFSLVLSWASLLFWLRCALNKGVRVQCCRLETVSKKERHHFQLGIIVGSNNCKHRCCMRILSHCCGSPFALLSCWSSAVPSLIPMICFAGQIRSNVSILMVSVCPEGFNIVRCETKRHQSSPRTAFVSCPSFWTGPYGAIGALTGQRSDLVWLYSGCISADGYPCPTEHMFFCTCKIPLPVLRLSCVFLVSFLCWCCAFPFVLPLSCRCLSFVLSLSFMLLSFVRPLPSLLSFV